jgi:hypothetical protein
MSLGIAIKSAEGIVLAADSRATIFSPAPAGLVHNPAGGPQPQVLIPATYDNATKLLAFPGRKMGAITFGAGSIGIKEPRTAASFATEFEASVADDQDLTVEQFAEKLGVFFTEQWIDAGMDPNTPMQANMVFYVAGFTGDESYGRLYDVHVPARPKPVEQQAGPGSYGMMWGGQGELVSRAILGFDPGMMEFIAQEYPALNLADDDKAALFNKLRERFNQRIPWNFLPLQDCVDIAVFLVEATISIQGWSTSIRGVGGAIDVAIITREGFRAVRTKEITTRGHFKNQSS